MYPRHAPEKAIEIEGALGDGSYFHQTHGYHAHAVGPESAKAPAGWEERLVPVQVPPRVRSKTSATAYCLEPHDLVLAKLAANPERDWDFARDALAAGLVAPDVLVARASDPPVTPQLRAAIASPLGAITGRLRDSQGS